MTRTPTAPKGHAIRADIRPEQVTAVIDTREQLPLDLSPLQVIGGGLPTGDYSVRGLEHVVAIERKSLSDLLGCVGQQRERFDKEMDRMRAYPCRLLAIESTWQEIESGNWRSQVTPTAVVGSLLGWQAMGIPIMLCGSHERCGQYVARFLFIVARRRWREARALVERVTEADEGRERSGDSE